jgi:hypothetical protein
MSISCCAVRSCTSRSASIFARAAGGNHTNCRVQADAAIVLESDLVPGADMYQYFKWMRNGLAAAPPDVQNRVFSV